MSNKTYDTLKFIGLIVLPGLATLVAGLTEIWGFEHGVQVAGTITAFGTFLGYIVTRSSKTYQQMVNEEEYDAGNEAE